MRIRRTLCLALAIGVCGASAQAKPKKPVDLSEWIDGPVRYISRRQEAKIFRSLPTDEDRALFIERFWARRDPSPETLTNAYRQIFWERVQQANELFLDSPKEGWITDRGKIYVLYGPPNEIQEDIRLQTTGIAGAGHGVIRWIYERRRGQREDLDPIVVVPFVRDAGGEYRLSYDPKLSSVFWDPNAIREKANADVERFYSLLGVPAGRSQLSVMLDLGRMQEVPPQEQVLLERVETSESYRTHPVESRVHRFYMPNSELTLVSVTVDISDSSPVQKPAIVARFSPSDATRKPRLLGEDSFKVVENSSGQRLAQGRLRLEPGDYELTVLVADPILARTGLDRGPISVPRPTERMRFSDVMFAADLESLRYASQSSYDEPFIVGPFRVVPRLSPVFRPGDTVKLFYEVYGAEYPMQVSYQLRGREDDGSWTDLGQPSLGERSAVSQAWDLQTSPNWPPGEYRIRIEALDAAGRMITSQRPFTLEAAPSAEQADLSSP